MNESSRFKESDAEVTVDNSQALAHELDRVTSQIEIKNLVITELQAQVKILKDTIVASVRGY